MKCVINQPSYIPWRGYFHQIQKADVFVFYDDVQYDRRGWRNRNRVKTANGPVLLTVPTTKVGTSQSEQKICDVEIFWAEAWNRKHWRTIELAYGKAPHF